jgi:hypothetical protein
LRLRLPLSSQHESLEPRSAGKSHEQTVVVAAGYTRVRLFNPYGVLRERKWKLMAVPTRQELKERIEELEEENQDLQERLDNIAELVAPDEDDDDDSGEE